ncbi:MAG: tetratricopeptide repeat protein [Planctomycetes bacterium]|nr:tetratricopeptide repeat protein [Planctomycetota bacterium]
MNHRVAALLSILPFLFLAGCDTLSLSRQGKETEKQKAVQYDQAWAASQEVLKKYFTVKKTDYATGQVVAVTLPSSVTFPKTRQKVVAEIADHGEGWYEVEVRVMNQIETSTADPFSQQQSHYDWKTIDFDEGLETQLVDEIYKEIDAREGNKNKASQPAAEEKGKEARQPRKSSEDASKISEPSAVNSRIGARSHLAFMTRKPSIGDPFVQALVLGDMHFKEGNYEGAEEQYLIAQKKDMENPITWFALGHARFARGDFAGASGALRTGLAGYKGWPTVKMDRRDFYGEPEDFYRQIAALEDWIKAHPLDAEAHFVLGYNYYFSGRPSLAAEAFKRASELQPDDSQVKEFLRLLSPDQVI